MSISVLCAIDDQEHSGWAADTAIDLARSAASHLTFFMANPAVLPGKGPVIYRWEKEYIERYFDEARWRARDHGVMDARCLTKNVLDIADGILAAAAEADADYIVVGSDQRSSSLAWNFRRSISRIVCSKSHCPTIVVRHRPRMRLVAAMQRGAA